MNIRIVNEGLNNDLCITVINLFLKINQCLNDTKKKIQCIIDIDDYLVNNNKFDFTIVFSKNDFDYKKIMHLENNIVIFYKNGIILNFDIKESFSRDFFAQLGKNIFFTDKEYAYYSICTAIIQKFYAKEIVQKCFYTENIANHLYFVPPNTLVGKALEYMNNNYKNMIKVKNIADFLCISERTLLRKFKEELNTTPSKVLQEIRIVNAKRLLNKTNKSFEQITMDIGYLNPSSFRKILKNKLGMTPAEYRGRS
jgi:AraC-like DNA-binding protein